MSDAEPAVVRRPIVAGDGPGDLPVLRSDLLGSLPYVAHGVTRRVPGLGRAEGNLGFGAPRDAADAWAMRRLWCGAIGLDPDRLVTTGQVHGATVVRVRSAQAGRGARPASTQIGLGDAMITDDTDVVLLSLHADCLPLLVVDPVRPAVAVVHAGWRGTVADVAGAAVRAMAAAFGSRPADLLAYLGPAIGGCCYEVGPEVAAAWVAQVGAAADQAITVPGKRPRFDLFAANRLLLSRAGVRSEQVEESGICTRCARDAWFSHRGQGVGTGRFGAVIALRG